MNSIARSAGVGLLALAAACSQPQGGEVGRLFGSSPAALTVDTTRNQIGRLTSSGAGATRTYAQYDTLGRAVVTQDVLDGTSYVRRSSYGYPRTALPLCTGNACGATGAQGTVVTASVLPDGERVTFGYDAAGAELTITAAPCADAALGTMASCTSQGAAQGIVLRILRNVRGQTTQTVLGDGTEQDHCYNDGVACSGGTPPNTDLRLNRIRTFVNATNTVLQDYGYSFDANGNISGIDDNFTPSLSATYTYDSLDRLSGMTSPKTSTTPFSYGYDDIGNLTTKEGGAQTYGGSGRGPHALATAAGLSYSYDRNGNLASRSDGLAIVWDAHDMPAKVSGGAAAAATQKFFIGEHLWKKVQGAVTTYYLGSLRIENGVPRKYYEGFAERDLDGSLKFYHGDQLNNSVLVTNWSGACVHRAAYLPYGDDRALTDCGAFTPRYQFNFKEKEQDGSGFYDYGARLYYPATGRWLSPDLATTDGLNRYAYVKNNPLIYRDPTGHDSQKPWWQRFMDGVSLGQQTYFGGNYGPDVDGIPLPEGKWGWFGFALGSMGAADGGATIGNPMKPPAAIAPRPGGTTPPEPSAPAATTPAVRPPAVRPPAARTSVVRTAAAGTPKAPWVGRVKLWKSTVDQIKAAAEKTEDGKFYIDPNTRERIPVNGKFDFGHKPGFEWWRTQLMAKALNWTRKQIIAYENDPSHYQIESPSSNRSHRFELPRNDTPPD